MAEARCRRLILAAHHASINTRQLMEIPFAHAVSQTPQTPV